VELGKPSHPSNGIRMMHRVLIVLVFSLAACRHPEPPPPSTGVSINVPGVRIRVADSPPPPPAELPVVIK
jgi:hypothetical protein